MCKKCNKKGRYTEQAPLNTISVFIIPCDCIYAEQEELKFWADLEILKARIAEYKAERVLQIG